MSYEELKALIARQAGQPWGGVRLNIKPQCYDAAQRTEAVRLASEKGLGARMEVHSSHTEYYATDTVPVGMLSVYACLTYKGPLEYIETLDTPEQELKPWELG